MLKRKRKKFASKRHAIMLRIKEPYATMIDKMAVDLGFSMNATVNQIMVDYFELFIKGKKK